MSHEMRLLTGLMGMDAKVSHKRLNNLLLLWANAIILVLYSRFTADSPLRCHAKCSGTIQPHPSDGPVPLSLVGSRRLAPELRL